MRNSTLALLLLGLVLAAQLQVAHGRSKGGASDSAARVRASLLPLNQNFAESRLLTVPRGVCNQQILG